MALQLLAADGRGVQKFLRFLQYLLGMGRRGNADAQGSVELVGDAADQNAQSGLLFRLQYMFLGAAQLFQRLRELLVALRQRLRTLLDFAF